MMMLQSQLIPALDHTGGSHRGGRGADLGAGSWHRSPAKSSRPRPKRRLKRSVRNTGLTLITLGLVGLMVRLAVPASAMLTTTGTPQRTTELPVTLSSPVPPASTVDDRQAPRITLGVRPAGYLIPDDGSEEWAHAGG